MDAACCAQGAAGLWRADLPLSSASAHSATQQVMTGTAYETRGGSAHAQIGTHTESAQPTPASALHDAQARAQHALANNLVTLWIEAMQPARGMDSFVAVPLRA